MCELSLLAEWLPCFLSVCITSLQTTGTTWTQLNRQYFLCFQLCNSIYTIRCRGNSCTSVSPHRAYLHKVTGLCIGLHGKSLNRSPILLKLKGKHNFLLKANIPLNIKYLLGGKLIWTVCVCVQGGVMGVQIRWDCDLDVSERWCVPRYTFRRLDNKDPENNVAPGYNFRLSHLLRTVSLTVE